MNFDRVAILVKKAALEADKVQAPILQSYDLTVAQYKFLKKLYYSPKDSVRVMDLENTFSMTHSTAIDILQVLEKKGYTTRIVNPKDARSKIVSLIVKVRLKLCLAAFICVSSIQFPIAIRLQTKPVQKLQQTVYRLS